MKRPKRKPAVFMVKDGVTIQLSAKRIGKICKAAWKLYKKIMSSI